MQILVLFKKKKGCYICIDTHLNNMGLSYWEKKFFFNSSGTLLLTEST